MHVFSLLRRKVLTFAKLRSNLVQIRFTSQKAVQTMAFKYPDANRGDVAEDYFGTKVADPYRWLEDPDADTTKSFVDAQNAVTKPYINSCPYKEDLNQTITKLWNFPKYSPPYRQGDNYFQYINSGLQNQSVIYKSETYDGDMKEFLDPNLFAEDGTVALMGKKFSKDGNTLAYGLSQSGSDWWEIKFRDVKTGKDYPEVLKKVKFSSMSFMHDNKGFFYGAYLDQGGKTDGSETDANENHKLYYHELGTDQSQDIVVVEFEDPKLRIDACVSYCGKYLVVMSRKGCKNNLLHYAKLNGKPTGKLELTGVVTELDGDYEYITNDGNIFYFHTNNGAPNYCVVVIDFDNYDKSNWYNLVDEHPKDVLDWASPINHDYLVLCYLQDVKNVLSIHRLKDGTKVQDLSTAIGSISSMSGKREHTEMFYSFTSFFSPNIIYRVTFDGPNLKQTLFHETKVGDINSSKYTCQQVFYPSKDGTKVPMFVFHKKDFPIDGSRPCMLYGYGGFNINLKPSFSIFRMAFINHFNGAFAVANIRGGGEYGDKWHYGGRFENKQNCFDDFQYAAKYLVQNRYTTHKQLTIMGGSNGGLLVAACINQAPELFGAAICQVGVLDMLRFHKFTIGYAWTSDYGSAETEEGFNYLYKYSPLHNIRVPPGDVQYPATLLLTGDHDDRVVPLHSLKFIAELQHIMGKVPKQTNPLMIRIDTKSGHGAGKPTSKLIEETTETLCFVGKSLNLEYVH